MSGKNTEKLRVKHWPEPSLLFKRGLTENIIDPRYGLSKFGPYDYNVVQRDFDEVELKVICYEHGEYPQEMLKLLKKLKEKVESKYRVHRMYPYEGFKELYKADIILPDASDFFYLKRSDISEILSSEDYDEFLNKFKELYSQKIQNILDNGYNKNTVICVHLPQELETKFQKFKGASELRGLGLRSIIKAIGVNKHVKTQIITKKALKPQDLADVLWNMSLAIYVKAGGAPWRLREIPPTSAFIGIRHGIRRDENGQLIAIGVVEIVNRYGEHISITAVDFSDKDLQYPDFFSSKPYLSKTGMRRLIMKAISEFEGDLQSVVIHRTLDFKEEEIDGITSALKSADVNLVHIVGNPDERILSDKSPKRGTFVYDENGNRGWLYTTGYTESAKMYLGIGTPKPLGLVKCYGERDLEELALQVFALTKMDWNTIRPMLRDPVTIKYAEKVVDLIKVGLKTEFTVKDMRYYF